MQTFSVKNNGAIANIVIADSLADAEELFGEGNVIEGAIPVGSIWQLEAEMWQPPRPVDGYHIWDPELLEWVAGTEPEIQEIPGTPASEELIENNN